MEKYNPREIEKKWQKKWEEKPVEAKDFSQKPKFYELVEFPYPSGSGLHVGHCMGYTASDVHSRKKRMQGYNVLFPIGWDAFGLPTENFAIKTGRKPAEVTKENTNFFRKQMKSLAYSFDWSREVNTTDPNYYKWTQWIFLQFYKHAYIDGKLIEVEDDDKVTPRMAYQAEMPINWCPSCKIGLANEEVINGKCERCGAETLKKMQKQWMLRISAYADRLIDDLVTTDYLEKVKMQQTNWIGRSEGVLFHEKIKDLDINFDVYDSIPQTYVAQTFTVIAPEHPLVKTLVKGTDYEKPVLEFVEKIQREKQQNKFDVEKDIAGIFTGRYVDNPFGTGDLPIWVASYVVADYGTGIVNCSAHDERDFNFAKKYDIPLRIAMLPPDKTLAEKVTSLEVYYGRDPQGIIQFPAEFKGMTWVASREPIIDYIEKSKIGKRSVQFKLRDWVFSRQHYWGEPIPIVHCNKCGTVPMDEKDLPLVLPDVDKYEPTDTGESPLAAIDSWVNTTCPVCKGPAKRETDTMPNWAGSSWYYLAYAMNNENIIMGNKVKGNVFNDRKEELKYWMPVDLYNGGQEHVTLHLLYSRFWHKFLYDLKVVPTLEPYQKRILHGIILGPDGRKMSKSFGNVINPETIVEKYGADTMRTYIMFIGPYDQESAWSEAGVQGVYRFLHRVWNNAAKVSDVEDGQDFLAKLHKYIVAIDDDIENFRLNTYVAKLMEINNEIDKLKKVSKQSWEIYLKLLGLATPHLAEELWSKWDDKGSIFDEKWPEANERYLVDEFANIAVQINGKVRGLVKIKADASKEEAQSASEKDATIGKWLNGRKVEKVIYVPGKILNFVVQ